MFVTLCWVKQNKTQNKIKYILAIHIFTALKICALKNKKKKKTTGREIWGTHLIAIIIIIIKIAILIFIYSFINLFMLSHSGENHRETYTIIILYFTEQQIVEPEMFLTGWWCSPSQFISLTSAVVSGPSAGVYCETRSQRLQTSSLWGLHGVLNVGLLFIVCLHIKKRVGGCWIRQRIISLLKWWSCLHRPRTIRLSSWNNYRKDHQILCVLSHIYSTGNC